MASLTLEQRKKGRFEVALDLRFSYQCGGSTRHGSARTLDLSDRAVCFEHDLSAPDGSFLKEAGMEMEVRIRWPRLLQSVCDLELVARGPVVRSVRGRAVMRIASYEFHTCGPRSFDESAAWGNSWNVLA